MNLLFRILVTSILVLVISYFFPSIAHVAGVKSAIIVAIVLGLLNVFVKPIFVLFTFPITVFSLGLFMLVINAAMIALCAKLVDGFRIVTHRAVVAAVEPLRCQRLGQRKHFGDLAAGVAHVHQPHRLVVQVLVGIAMQREEVRE